MSPSSSFRYLPVMYADDSAAGAPGLDGAAAAMQARLDAAIDGGTASSAASSQGDSGSLPDGTGDLRAAPAAEVDPFSDEALDSVIPEGIQWRDARALRDDMRKFRDRYKPVHEALGGLDDDARGRVLAAAPRLGGDLAVISDVFANLHESDRAYFVDALGALTSGDPAEVARAAQMLADGAAILRGESPAGQTASDEPDEFDDDDDDRPLTKAEMERFYADKEQERVYADQQAQLRTTIVGELKELGYDVAKAQDDPIEQARIAAILDVAQRPENGGDLKKAHAVLDGWRQRHIDDYVAAKSADAGRISNPASAGGAPSQERTLETLDDAREAMDARLDAHFGPARRL